MKLKPYEPELLPRDRVLVLSGDLRVYSDAERRVAVQEWIEEDKHWVDAGPFLDEEVGEQYRRLIENMAAALFMKRQPCCAEEPASAE